MNSAVRKILLCSVALLMTSCEMPDPVPRAEVPYHKYGAGDGGGTLGLHTVRSGETVWVISQQYSLALRDILDMNHLQAPYSLSAGQRIQLPAPQTYKVRAGDSLYTISRLFDSSTTEIARLNKLKAPYRLESGQVLKVPAKPVPSYQSVAYQPAVIKPPQASEPPQTNGSAAVPPAVERQGLYVPPPFEPPSDDDGVVRSKPTAAPPNPTVQKVSVPASVKSIGAPPAREGKFIKPVSGKVISSYGPKQDGLHNDGINIQAARGDAVRAAESGVVVYTGDQIEGYGNLILIRHTDQFVTAYAHLDKTLVKKGDKVKRGQSIGTVGSTGSVDKPQLHFEIRKGTKALNPAQYL